MWVHMMLRPGLLLLAAAFGAKYFDLTKGATKRGQNESEGGRGGE